MAEDSGRVDLRSVTGKIDVILGAFTVDDIAISLAELVRRTELSKTTVHRICQVCVAWGVLERSGTDYRLGIRLFELGQRVPRQRIVRDAARPVMQELIFRTKAVVHLAVLDGLDALVIERLSGHRPSRLTQIAGRMPLHCSAVGKALLAVHHPDLMEEVLRQGLHRRTPYTITSANVFMQSIERARAVGYATELEEMNVGYVAAGAVVFGRRRDPMAALSVTVPMHNANMDQLGAMTTAGANAIAANLVPKTV